MNAKIMMGLVALVALAVVALYLRPSAGTPTENSEQQSEFTPYYRFAGAAIVAPEDGIADDGVSIILTGDYLGEGADNAMVVGSNAVRVSLADSTSIVRTTITQTGEPFKGTNTRDEEEVDEAEFLKDIEKSGVVVTAESDQNISGKNSFTASKIQYSVVAD